MQKRPILWVIPLLLLLTIVIVDYTSQRAPLGRVTEEITYSYMCGTYGLSSPVAASASGILVEDETIYDPVNAIDGVRSTMWKSSGQTPQWIAFSLGELKCMNSIELSVDNSGLPMTVNVEVSDEGDNWQTVVEGRQIIQTDTVIEFPEIVGGYVRVYQVNTAVSYGTLSEVKVNNAQVDFAQGGMIVEYCGDSDGGSRYHIPGLVNSSQFSGSRFDVCINSTTLREQICRDVEPSEEIFTCPAGSLCEEGACVVVDEVPEVEEETTVSNVNKVAITDPLNAALQPGEKVNFLIIDSMHTIAIKEVFDGSTELLLDNLPVVMSSMEIRSFDMTGDGINDVRIELHSTSEDSNEAKLSIYMLSSAYLLKNEQCFAHPPLCPPSGEQTQICVDTRNPALGASTEALSCSPGLCQGCARAGICLPYGTRLRDYEDDATDKYCAEDGTLRQQKDILALSPSGANAPGTCSFNYECVSNICTDGQCVVVEEVISKAPAQKSTTVQVLCRAAYALDEKEYESCLVQFLAEAE